MPTIQSPALAAPGVAAAPPDLSSVASVQGTIESLGLVGAAANAIGSYYQNEYEQQQQDAAILQREVDRNAQLAERVNAVQRGEGAIAATASLPELASKIERGEGPFARDLSLTPSQQAEQVVSAITEGMPASMAEGYRKAVLDNFATLYQRRDDAIRADNEATIIEGAQASSIAAGADVAGIDAAKKALELIPGMTEVQRYKATYLTALKAAADSGDVERFNAINAGMPGNMLAPEREALKLQISTHEARRVKTLADEVENSIHGLIYNGDTSGALDAIGGAAGKAISFEKAAQLRNQVVKTSQARLENDVRGAVMSGAYTPEQVREQLAPFMARPPEDPLHVPATTAQSIINLAEQVNKVDIAKSQVRAALGGAGSVNVTEAQHGAALVGVLTDSGIIGGGNNITNGEQFAIALLRAPALNTTLKEILVANLNGGSPESRIEAAKAIGMMGAQNPIMEAKLLDMGQNNPGLRAQIQTAMDQYRMGNLSAPDKVAGAVNTIAQAGEIARKQGGPTEEGRNAIARIAPDPQADTLKILQGMYDLYPQMADGTTFGIDIGLGYFNPDPSFDSGSSRNVMRRIEGWYVNEFTALDGQPIEVQKKLATDRTKARVVDAIDMVRWNDSVYPTNIDGINGTSFKLPGNLRWTAEFEDEAKADLKAAKIDVDEVSRPVPYVSGNQIGWAFKRSDSDDLLRDAAGVVLLFTPSDKAAAAAEQYQQIREGKLQERKKIIQDGGVKSPMQRYGERMSERKYLKDF